MIHIYVHDTYIRTYITLHYITLHCIALHFITLHYIHTYIYIYIYILYIYICILYTYIYIYCIHTHIHPQHSVLRSRPRYTWKANNPIDNILSGNNHGMSWMSWALSCWLTTNYEAAKAPSAAAGSPGSKFGRSTKTIPQLCHSHSALLFPRLCAKMPQISLWVELQDETPWPSPCSGC